MSKKRNVRGIVISMVGAVVLGAFCVPDVYADEVSIEQDNVVISRSSVRERNETKSAKLVWFYKEENGKKYRRLYDATNEVWLTNWILC